MSLLGTKVGVVSLGMSCQSAHQIEHHARLIGTLTGDPSAITSRFPFDNLICPPPSAIRMLQADRFHPESMEDLTVGEGAYWWQMDAHFWQEFRPKRSGLFRRKIMDPVKAFSVLTQKYEHTGKKFRALSSVPRLIFVISNSQNNLEMVSRVTGNVGVMLDLTQVEALADRTDAYLGRACEYIVVTYPDRVTGRSVRSNVSVFELKPDDSEWMGDPAQWSALFQTALAPRAAVSSA